MPDKGEAHTRGEADVSRSDNCNTHETLVKLYP
jgi:hypothetical protein